MRYHEFKIVKEGFWSSLIDLTRGGNVDQVAEKTWMTNFAQTVKTRLDTAIKSGVVNPRLTTDLNPNDASLRNPSSRNDYSISQYIYLFLDREYSNNVYASLNSQNKTLFINAINKVQDEYPIDNGKKALMNLAGVYLSIMNTSRPDPVAPPPPAPAAPPKITSMAPFPIGKLVVNARVGDKVEKFRYFPGSKQWLDKNNRVIRDAESIDALNKIAKSQSTP